VIQVYGFFVFANFALFWPSAVFTKSYFFPFKNKKKNLAILFSHPGLCLHHL
jgi:hypothetical protein